MRAGIGVVQIINTKHKAQSGILQRRRNEIEFNVVEVFAFSFSFGGRGGRALHSDIHI